MPSSKSGAKPEKTMSSRLLTMKFMQRAAATKESSQPQSAEGSKTPTPKRPRLSVEGQLSDPEPSSDLDAISAALAAEEGKRKEAVSRQAADAGETEWVLDYSGAGQTQQPPVVVAAGSLDDDDISYGGRQSYGNFKRKKNTAENHNVSHDDEDEDAGNRKIGPAEVQALVERESRKPKLSHLTSLSGTRQASIGGNNMSQKKRKHK